MRGSRAVSISLSTMCFGVGMSGLPMPKSMMSSPLARLGLELVDLLENIGRKPADAMEFFHEPSSLGSPTARLPRRFPALLRPPREGQEGDTPKRSQQRLCGLFSTFPCRLAISRGSALSAIACCNQILFELLLLLIGEHRFAAGRRHVVHRRIGACCGRPRRHALPVAHRRRPASDLRRSSSWRE